jgi:hypothetical protein
MENPSTSSAAWSGGSRILVGILSLAVAGVVAAAVVTKGGGRTVEASIPASTSVISALEHTISTENSDAGQAVSSRLPSRCSCRLVRFPPAPFCMAK